MKYPIVTADWTLKDAPNEPLAMGNYRMQGNVRWAQ